MSYKDKKVILIANCLVNPYCRVHILGQNFPLSTLLLDYLMKQRVGVIQYLCPETTAMGLKRNPQGRQQYDNLFFRNHCKELLKTPMLMLREFLQNKFRVVGYIGVENSPTCAVNWGKHKTNKHGLESPNPVEDIIEEQSTLLGIMAELLQEELEQFNISIPFFELPIKSVPGSDKRKEFWYDLRKSIELKNQTLSPENAEIL